MMMEANTKEKILAAASELFAKDGYNGVSVRAIARAVGITEGSIYNHFVSKEEIMDEILTRHEQELERAVPSSRELIDSYGREGWKPAWAVRAKLMETAPASSGLHIILILMNEQYRSEKARNIVTKYYMEEPVRVTCDLLRHIEAQGKPLPGDAMTLARAYQYPIFCMLQEYEMTVSLGGDVAPVLQKIQDHVAFFWKNIMKIDYDE